MRRAQEASKALSESLTLLRSRRFGTFWFASFLSNIGTWAQAVAEPWLLLNLGASSFLVGLDSFAMHAPVLALTLVGGVLADRADRRKVIALFQTIQMACPTLIVVLLLAKTAQPWMVIVLAFVVGITDALSMPSFQSIVPSIVPREQIGRGLALNSTQFNLSRIVGPAIAGVVMSGAGAVACFVLSAVSYIPFVGVAVWILPRRTGSATTRAGPLDLRHPMGGIRAILGVRPRFALVTVLAMSLLSAPLLAFIPILVRDAFSGDASMFSLALAGFGVGGLLGAIAMLALPQGCDQRLLASLCALGYGIVLVLASWNPWFWGVPTLLIVAGAMMTMSNTAANTLLQATVAPALLGQAVSLFMLALRGGLALGSLMMGATVSLFGVRLAILINGLIAVAGHLALERHFALKHSRPSALERV